jgi:hypothetical protein
VVPLLRGHPIRQRKVASQKGWPFKRGITMSGSQLDMARFERDVDENNINAFFCRKLLDTGLDMARFELDVGDINNIKWILL